MGLRASLFLHLPSFLNGPKGQGLGNPKRLKLEPECTVGCVNSQVLLDPVVGARCWNQHGGHAQLLTWQFFFLEERNLTTQSFSTEGQSKGRERCRDPEDATGTQSEESPDWSRLCLKDRGCVGHNKCEQHQMWPLVTANMTTWITFNYGERYSLPYSLVHTLVGISSSDGLDGVGRHGRETPRTWS